MLLLEEEDEDEDEHLELFAVLGAALLLFAVLGVALLLLALLGVALLLLLPSTPSKELAIKVIKRMRRRSFILCIFICFYKI